MPAQLLALTEGPSILLDKPILLLGRHPECDIQLESRKVSRRHCCIAQVGNYLVVRDLGSTNGIRINGVRTVEGSLKPGDELTIGSHRYQVQWDDLGGQGGRGRARSADRAPAARPAPPALPAEDDLRLEEAEEPIPLDESPEVAGRAPPAKKAARLDKPPENGNPPRPAGAKAQESSGPHVLPDQLELAPASDILPAVHPPRADDADAPP